jgi:adenylate cyclase class 2
MSSGREIEIKLRVADVKSARRLLSGAGFRVAKRRVLERNIVWDTAELALRRKQELLRVREAGRTVTLTYKGPAEAGKHKSREEREVRCSDAGALSLIFERLGYQPVFRYEKYRTEFRQQGRPSGVATVDETPIGVFLELEGSPEWIDRTARKLGYEEGDYITASYGRLYLEWRGEQEDKPRDMEFVR